jgi:hypothetical protein
MSEERKQTQCNGSDKMVLNVCVNTVVRQMQNLCFIILFHISTAKQHTSGFSSGHPAGVLLFKTYFEQLNK